MDYAYLDDFLVIGAPGTEDCRLAVRKLQNVLDGLGFPVAMEKPVQSSRF